MAQPCLSFCFSDEQNGAKCPGSNYEQTAPATSCQNFMRKLLSTRCLDVGLSFFGLYFADCFMLGIPLYQKKISTKVYLSPFMSPTTPTNESVHKISQVYAAYLPSEPFSTSQDRLNPQKPCNTTTTPAPPSPSNPCSKSNR